MCASARNHDGRSIQLAAIDLKLKLGAPLGPTPEIERRKRSLQSLGDVEQRHVRHHLRQAQSVPEAPAAAGVHGGTCSFWPLRVD